MYNAKIKVLHETLKSAGVVISDELAATIIEAVTNARDVEFEIGDFVMCYEGMGEVGYGKVEGFTVNGYRVRPYFAGKFEDYAVGRTRADVRELSTEKDADDYDAIRRGLV